MQSSLSVLSCRPHFGSVSHRPASEGVAAAYRGATSAPTERTPEVPSRPEAALTPRQRRLQAQKRRWQQEQNDMKQNDKKQPGSKRDSGIPAPSGSPECRDKSTGPAKSPPSMPSSSTHTQIASKPSSLERHQTLLSSAPPSTSGRNAGVDGELEWSLWSPPGHVERVKKQLLSVSSAKLAWISKTWAEEWVRAQQSGGATLGCSALLNVEVLASCARERLRKAQASTQHEIETQHLSSAARPGSADSCLQKDLLFSQQDLADLAWALSHFNHPAALEFEQAMQVPFKVLPFQFQHLELEPLLTEIELRQDEIHLDGRSILESRRTAWQSDIGATFCYSGKEMLPASHRMTPEVAKVRDRLVNITGTHFDSVLINYYPDGRCGMRFHVDPLYGCWTPNTAVVSVGQTRRFTFRELTDFSSRWDYSVRNGDVVFMFSDCQERLQHSVKVEREDKGAADIGPRMSLVFKQRMKDSNGQYVGLTAGTAGQ